MATFLTTTGYGLKTVEVSYEYDFDTNTVDLTITWQGKEISGLLSEEANNDIEMECFAHQRKLDKIDSANAAYDRGADLYAERLAA